MSPIPFETTPGISSIPLLHGAGGAYDELIIFGGIGLLLIVLAYLSWRASANKEKRRRRRKTKNL
ncbi:MAG: hypothetical protein O3B95_07605 [Chloroflexi bacterium]|nr:hypothetical protein [Chloroflexota bacterium]